VVYTRALGLKHTSRRTIFLGAPTGTIRPQHLPTPALHPRLRLAILEDTNLWLAAILRFVKKVGYPATAVLSTLADLLTGSEHLDLIFRTYLRDIILELDGHSFVFFANSVLKKRKSNRFSRNILKAWFVCRPPKILSYEFIRVPALADILRITHAKPSSDLGNTCVKWMLRGPTALNTSLADPARSLQALWVHEAARTVDTVEDAVQLIERFHCQIRSFKLDFQRNPSVQAMFISTARPEDLIDWLDLANPPKDPALQLLLSSRIPDICSILDPICLVPLYAGSKIGSAVDNAIITHTTVNMKAGHQAPKTCVVLDTSRSLGIGTGNIPISRAKAVAIAALRLRGRGTLYFAGSSFRDFPNDLDQALCLIQEDWVGSIPYPSKVLDICTTHNIPFDTFVFIGDQTEHLREDTAWLQKLEAYRNKIGLPSKALFISVSSTTRCMRPTSDPYVAEIKGVTGFVPKIVFDFSTSWDRFFTVSS